MNEAGKREKGKDQRLPEVVELGPEVCGDLVQAERREWWLANGRGGYAAGTIAGSLTRRYHGLLVAPVHPPLGRMLLAAKADATVRYEGEEWPLFTNRWTGETVNPAGHVRIESFRLEGTMPVWRFAAGWMRVEARIWMEPGADTTYVVWKLLADPLGEPQGAELAVRLLVNCRDHHGQTAAGTLAPELALAGNRVTVAFAEGVTLRISVCGGDLRQEHAWIEGFDLPAERDRGLPDRESHLAVGVATLPLVPGRWVGVVFSREEGADMDLHESLARRLSRDARVIDDAVGRSPELAGAPEWIRQLLLAADSFIFARPLPDLPDGESVIAGYPWFGDWGRDTMISLPGLCLVTGRYETALRILRTFIRFVERGMLPNVFFGSGEIPEYNTVDAALWYVEAWRACLEATGDIASLREAFPVLTEIVRHYREGTRYGIRMDPADSLLFAGEPGVQLTWMDAKVGETVFTPRIGKPVEINALWYNAHCALADFADHLGLASGEYRERAEAIRRGFKRYWNGEAGGLFDVIDGPDGNDGTLRPNQILAVSLPHTPLDRETQRQVVLLCKRKLLASCGLRSLDPGDPAFRPRYAGGVWDRDSGYHQGPVWGWLLGHFALAEYRVHGDPALAQASLEPVRFHLSDSGLGTVSEIFDGAPPHTPRGCPSQAWSVASVLDAWLRLEQASKSDRK